MPRFPNRTVAVAVNHLSLGDDEDNDICPVCDGDCTCNNRPHPLPANVSHGNARFVVTQTASTASSTHALGAQPLKIKLIVPPSTQNRPRGSGSAPNKSRSEDSPAASNGVAGSSSVSSRLTSVSSIAGHGQHNPSDLAPKRRRRAPKAAAIAVACDGATKSLSDHKIRGNAVNTLPSSQSHLSSHSYTQRLVTSRATRSQVETSKSNLAASRRVSKSQAKGTIANRLDPVKKQESLSNLTVSSLQASVDDDDGDDLSSDHFPTFVLADGLTSEASDSSDSECDSDVSGFGSDLSLAAEEENYIVAEQRRHDKARVRRELLGDDVPRHREPNNNWVLRPRKKSVGPSDVDMEDTDNNTEEEDEDEDEMEDDGDEDEEDDEADGQATRVYTGLATGWSDDEESSFDADLFFANLTDDSSDDGSSDSDCNDLQDSATDPLANSVTSLQSADFEVTEAWDGQVVFTNGSNDGHGVLDLAFEANAARLLASDSASITHDSDVEMHTSDDGEGDGHSELGASDGETTEEELVDEQGLPTSRAMKLFRWPTSVSSINPMSTVSPNVSPAPFSRRHPPSAMLESPRPADILAGKVFWEEVERPQQDSTEGSAEEGPRPLSKTGMPIMGQFSLGINASQKTAILTGTNKDVPSPYPRFGRRRRRFSSSAGSFSSVDLRGRTARLSIYPSLPPSDELPSETPLNVGLGEPIKLDDVLDPTFLDSEPETSAFLDSEGEQKFTQSLSRWDHVPVDAFRLTARESVTSPSDVPTSPGWTSEPSNSSAPEMRPYGNALKSSPLHTMLWNDKGGIKEKSRKSKGLVISPVLLPVRDGDRTPTHIPYHHDLHSNHRQQHAPFKTQKESRREMKMMKRKTQAPGHHDHHKRHHRRNHHPNMKSRSNASMQRTFFSSPTTAPVLNI